MSSLKRLSQRWDCSTKTLHYAPSESGSRRKTFAEIRWKKWFGLCSKMGRMWLYRGKIGKERDGKLGINIDHVTKHSRIDVREESSIFSVLYQPTSASMKSARDISVMSTNLDARRTQQVSFMLLFSCLWPLMGSIQYVNNMIKLKAHSRVCVCMKYNYYINMKTFYCVCVWGGGVCVRMKYFPGPEQSRAVFIQYNTWIHLTTFHHSVQNCKHDHHHHRDHSCMQHAASCSMLHAWMVAMMMMIMFTILYTVMKCCKMDPSVILNEYSSWLFWAREIFHTYTHPPPTHTHNKRFSYLYNNCISWFIGFLHLGIGMITHTWFWIHDIIIHCRPPWFKKKNT